MKRKRRAPSRLWATILTLLIILLTAGCTGGTSDETESPPEAPGGLNIEETAENTAEETLLPAQTEPLASPTTTSTEQPELPESPEAPIELPVHLPTPLTLPTQIPPDVSFLASGMTNSGLWMFTLDLSEPVDEEAEYTAILISEDGQELEYGCAQLSATQPETVYCTGAPAPPGEPVNLTIYEEEEEQTFFSYLVLEAASVYIPGMVDEFIFMDLSSASEEGETEEEEESNTPGSWWSGGPFSMDDFYFPEGETDSGDSSADESLLDWLQEWLEKEQSSCSGSGRVPCHLLSQTQAESCAEAIGWGELSGYYGEIISLVEYLIGSCGGETSESCPQAPACRSLLSTFGEMQQSEEETKEEPNPLACYSEDAPSWCTAMNNWLNNAINQALEYYQDVELPEEAYFYAQMCAQATGYDSQVDTQEDVVLFYQYLTDNPIAEGETPATCQDLLDLIDELINDNTEEEETEPVDTHDLPGGIFTNAALCALDYPYTEPLETDDEVLAFYEILQQQIASGDDQLPASCWSFYDNLSYYLAIQRLDNLNPFLFSTTPDCEGEHAGTFFCQEPPEDDPYTGLTEQCAAEIEWPEALSYNMDYQKVINYFTLAAPWLKDPFKFPSCVQITGIFEYGYQAKYHHSYLDNLVRQIWQMKAEPEPMAAQVSFVVPYEPPAQEAPAVTSPGGPTPIPQTICIITLPPTTGCGVPWIWIQSLCKWMCYN